MVFEIPQNTYAGKIKELKLGKGPKTISVGGETSFPFYLFEGKMPHPPRIAMEVYDAPPEDWAEAALEPFKDVSSDPVSWALKCVKDYGAELVALQLVSTDPNGLNRSPEEASETVKKVANVVDVPMIVWGSGNAEKDSSVLQKVAEVCEEMNLIIGPLGESNYKQISPFAIKYKHIAIASSPIDINLAKQLNILLGHAGVPDEQMLMDPTTGGLGYGIEYTYSVIERDRVAALMQQDERLQFPIICNMAKEVWKTKEAKVEASEAPLLGNAKKRGILMEAITGILLLLAGADILVMRHPHAIQLVREMISEWMVQ
jgi:acetyl-CoA decarbonylase/synthase complex subunit delta